MEKSEALILVALIGTAIFVLLLISIIVFTIRFNKKKVQHQEEKKNFQQELLRTQLEIQEQTLKNISQEIHDNIGQVLSLAKLNLNTINMAKLNEVEEKILDSRDLVSKAIQDLRDLAKSMNTDSILSLGLIRAIEYELDILRKGGFEVRLAVEGRIIKLEPQKELITFRIIQEIFNNIIKHAEASSISIRALFTDIELTLLINDNGKGFDISNFNEEKDPRLGIGIRNMNNRAKLIGADFSMNSDRQKGTEVRLTVPFIDSTT